MENNNAIEVLRELVRVEAYGSFTTTKGTYSFFEVGVALEKALLELEREKKYKVFVADMQERIWLHEAREPSSYILSDLRLFFKQRLKELKLNE